MERGKRPAPAGRRGEEGLECVRYVTRLEE
jgi:hypothetical protein